MFLEKIPFLEKLTFLDKLDSFSLGKNSLKDFLEAIIVFLILFGLLKLFQKVILQKLRKLAKKTKTDIDDVLIKIFDSIKPSFVFFLAAYLSVQLLVLGDIVSKIINAILIIWVVYQVIKGVQIFIDYLVERASRKEKEESTKTGLRIIGKIARGVLWIFGVLLILSNLGVKITSLVAGLGIGGVAIAFALQNILADLFSSFSIYFDKPFVIGDFIVVGKDVGVVKNIGIKTTRLQALQGEEIVISNKELTSTRVQNFKKLQERRIVLSFGVVYDTSLEKLKKINNIVKEIIDNEEKVHFDRCHFVSFDDSALSFEVIYFVESPDYTEYRDRHQNILFEIKKRFEKENISMAYPTQTVYLKK